MARMLRLVDDAEPETVLLEEPMASPSGLSRGAAMRLRGDGEAQSYEVVEVENLVDLESRDLVEIVRLRRKPPGLLERLDGAYQHVSDDLQVGIALLILLLVLVPLALVVITYLVNRPLLLAWLGYLARPVIGWSLFLAGISTVALVTTRVRTVIAQRVLGIGTSVLTLVLVGVWLELSRPARAPVAWPDDWIAYWGWLSNRAGTSWLPVLAPALGWLAMVAGLLGWSAVEKVLGRLGK